MPHFISMRGTVRNPETGELGVVQDKGYSFCNCKNIWYTDWENIDQRVYGDEYVEKYNTDFMAKAMDKYAKEYFPKILKHKTSGYFADVGSPHAKLLKNAKKVGYTPLRIDIDNNTDDDIETLIGDFEYLETDKKMSVIWISHVFEHFKDPIESAKKCYSMLKDGGVLFVAMPDPFFIDWESPYQWSHWHLREHHTLWDMESFIETLEEIGFKCVFKHRNLYSNFICNGDYHLLFKK